MNIEFWFPERGKEAMYSIPTDEQETIIQISRNGNIMSIYTSDSSMIIKLDHLCEKSEHYKCTKVHTVEGKVVSKEYEATKKMLSFRTKNRVGNKNNAKYLHRTFSENLIEPDKEIIEEE